MPRCFLFVFGIIYMGLILTQCKKKPEGTIEHDILVDMLVDLHILGVSYRDLDRADSLYTEYWTYIENKYDIQKEDFKKHYLMLTESPEDMKGVYNQVKEKLQDQRDIQYNAKYDID